LTDALTGAANGTNTKGVTPRGHTFLLSNAVPNAGLVPPGRYCRPGHHAARLPALPAHVPVSYRHMPPGH